MLVLVYGALASSAAVAQAFSTRSEMPAAYLFSLAAVQPEPVEPALELEAVAVVWTNRQRLQVPGAPGASREAAERVRPALEDREASLQAARPGTAAVGKAILVVVSARPGREGTAAPLRAALVATSGGHRADLAAVR